ncbi:MAG: hypothetical protein ACLFQ8_00540 [Candidatus Aenigmatarchaeota archaeon]
MSDSEKEEIDCGVSPGFIKHLYDSLLDHEKNRGPHKVEEGHGNSLDKVIMGERFVTDSFFEYRNKRLVIEKEGGSDYELPGNYVIDAENSETDNIWLQEEGL